MLSSSEYLLTYEVSPFDEASRIINVIEQRKAEGETLIHVLDVDDGIEKIYGFYGLNPNFEIVVGYNNRKPITKAGYTRSEVYDIVRILEESGYPLVAECDDEELCRQHVYYSVNPLTLES